MDLQNQKPGVMDISVRGQGEQTELTIKLPRQQTSDLIKHLSNLPGIGMKSFRADHTSSEAAAANKEADTVVIDDIQAHENPAEDKSRNAFIIFPSEVLYKLKTYLYTAGVITLLTGVYTALEAGTDLSPQARILITTAVLQITFLIFLLKAGVKYYMSYLTHDTSGEVEIITKKSIFRPAKITMASNVIRATAEYDNLLLSFFDIGNIKFFDASKDIEPNIFHVSEPQFWVKVYKLHA